MEQIGYYVSELEQQSTSSELMDNASSFDYSHVDTIARVAVYDDMKMPPRIIKIQPAETTQFIENLASCINEQKTMLGGGIPYSAIREVTENFIHAQFQDIVVSILDKGNTIRFCDQGPGIQDKEKAVLPGFTSAIEPMSNYIRGVGSGLPIVKEYLDVSDGYLTIEDNIEHGAVVTLSLQQDIQDDTPRVFVPPFTEREEMVFKLFSKDTALGVTDITASTGLAGSSVHAILRRLEESNLIETTRSKKRVLTDYGFAVSKQLK